MLTWVLRISLVGLVAQILATVAVAAHPLEGRWDWQSTVLRTGDIIDPDSTFVELRDFEAYIPGLWSLSEVQSGGQTLEYLRVFTGGVVPYLEGALDYATDGSSIAILNDDTVVIKRTEVSFSPPTAWERVKTLYR